MGLNGRALPGPELTKALENAESAAMQKVAKALGLVKDDEAETDPSKLMSQLQEQQGQKGSDSELFKDGNQQSGHSKHDHEHGYSNQIGERHRIVCDKSGHEEH